MTKEEYISRYGEEAYKKKLAYVRDLRKGIMPQKEVDFFTCKIYGSVPITGYEDCSTQILSSARAAVIDSVATEIQKIVRKLWARQTDRQNIIIVTGGNVKKDRVPYTIELYQRWLKPEEIRVFKEITTKIEPQNLEPQN